MREKHKADINNYSNEIEEQKREQFLSESIYTLGLSVRASSCLSRGGIDTIGKLLEADVETIRKIRNVGEKILNEALEIRERLIVQLQLPKTVEDEKEPEITEEQKREEFLSKSIYTLDLSVLASNCLNRGGIDTIGKLLETDEGALKKIRNLGKKILKETLEMQGKIRKQIESEELDKEETDREQKEKELARYMQEDSELDDAISKAERLEQIQENENKTVDE